MINQQYQRRMNREDRGLVSQRGSGCFGTTKGSHDPRVRNFRKSNLRQPIPTRNHKSGCCRSGSRFQGRGSRIVNASDKGDVGDGLRLVGLLPLYTAKVSQIADSMKTPSL